MEQYYLVLLAFLAVIAVIDLFVGVSNDAVNFLNSAIGCRIASFRTTLWVASLGVLAGATFSSGMMEVARSGIFHPQMLSFSELMIVFFAVMVADVILLDTFNSLGLPTSTTVSIVFELLGSALASALYKLISSGMPITNAMDYINASKSLSIVSGILISVVVAFIAGTVCQYLARLVFSFRIEKAYRRFGALYGGLAVTAIIYFLVMKGAKGASFMRPEWLKFIADNTGDIVVAFVLGFTILFQILIFFFNVNIFKILILLGTFSLAFAFAGNDLVNFVGVPLAAWDSFNAWQASGALPNEFMMTGLLKHAQAPTLFLLAAGFVMVATLWFSKKAMRVVQTSINLSSSRAGTEEQFGASLPGRVIVRTSMGLGRLVNQFIPQGVRRTLDSRFEPAPVVKGQPELPFDYVRASVNLMVSAVLIACATSLKLPLSTTYVTFMVAMGSSFADGAWDRESAVYRITGVLTVISGWFLTALSASTLAAVVAILIFLGGEAVAILLGILAIGLLIRSNFKKSDDAEGGAKGEVTVWSAEAVRARLADTTGTTLTETLDLLRHILRNFGADRERELTRLRNAATDLYDETSQNRSFYYRMAEISPATDKVDFDARYCYLRACTNTREVARALQNLAKLAREHVANRHRVMTSSVVRDIAELIDELIRTVGSADGKRADVLALRARAPQLIARIERLQHRLIESQPKEHLSIRCCEFYLNYLLVLRELINHYEIASLLEEQIGLLRVEDVASTR